MNKIKIIARIFLIFTAFTFSSCENEPIDSAINADDFGNPSSGPLVFKADFSGTTWNATAAQAEISGGLIQIVGTKANGDSFAFLIEGSTVGNYAANANLLTFLPAGSQFGYWSINVANEAENTGTISITSIDAVNKKISGTFAYKGYWSDTTVTSILPVQFTNGVFTNIPYTGTVSASDDSFFAKVDGVDFVENQIDGSLITNVSGMPDQISIVGSKTNGDNVGLNIVRSLGVGTYNFTGPLGDQVNGRCLFSNALYSADSGSLTITSKTDTRIQGSFNMIVKNFTTSATKTITAGTFDVVYN